MLTRVRMRKAFYGVVGSLLILATQAMAGATEGGKEGCLPSESSGAACQLAKSIVRKGPVVLRFDQNEADELPLTLAHASRKTADTTTSVRRVEKRPALEAQAQDWCKAFNR
jgi:hypothetical protein